MDRLNRSSLCIIVTKLYYFVVGYSHIAFNELARVGRVRWSRIKVSFKYSISFKFLIWCCSALVQRSAESTIEAKPSPLFDKIAVCFLFERYRCLNRYILTLRR